MYFWGVKGNILCHFVLRYSSAILIHKAGTMSGNSRGLEARIKIESGCLLCTQVKSAAIFQKWRSYQALGQMHVFINRTLSHCWSARI